jgi:hypothetical protein
VKSCPTCQHPVQGSFGMVVCGSCGAAVFFDLDGNPQMPSSLDESSDAVVDQEPQVEELQLEEPQEKPQPEELQLEQLQLEEPTESTDLMGDVLEFANKPTNEVVGNLSYSISIKGIDTIDLKKALLEELRDKKLGWNINEIESRIEFGTLELKELNPTQAALIVKRLKPLKLAIQWKQIL